MDTELLAVTTKSQAAAVTGLDEGKIHEVAFELSYLRRNGLLIDVMVSGVGMFTRSAQLAEFGINQADEKAARYTAGSKYLIPKSAVDKLRSVETRMRQAHQKYAVDVTGFRPYRWLPYTGYDNFKRRWFTLSREFYSVKDEIIENLDYYRDLLADEFAAGARKTWAAIEGQGFSAIIFNGTGYLYRDSFVDAVVNAALASFPSAEKIEQELQADYKVGVIYTDFDENVAVATSQANIAKLHAERRAASLQADVLQSQLDHQTRMQQLEQIEREEKIQAMVRAEMAHAKDQLEQIKSPFDEVFLCLRQDIAQACEEIKASVDKNGFVRGKVAERAAGLVELYDLMAAHNDKELRAKLLELKSKIGKIGDQRVKDTPTRSPLEIANTLKEIIEMANLEASELSNLSRAAFVEV